MHKLLIEFLKDPKQSSFIIKDIKENNSRKDLENLKKSIGNLVNTLNLFDEEIDKQNDRVNNLQVINKDDLWSREEYEKLMRRIKEFWGSVFIAAGYFKEGHSNYVIIDYFKNFNNYINNNPATTLTRREFNNYFQDQVIKKILIMESFRIIRSFPKVETVEINVPAFGEYVGIVLNRKSLADYMNGSGLEYSEYNEWEDFMYALESDSEMKDNILKKFGNKAITQ